MVVLREIMSGLHRFDDMWVRTQIPRQVLANRLAMLADPEGSPLAAVHRDCGAEVHAELTCAAGHRVTASRDVLPAPGPGAHPRTAGRGHRRLGD